MTTVHILSISGGLCGSLGSILTAFSMTDTLRELGYAGDFLRMTTEALAGRGPVPIFTEIEQRMARAARRDKRVLWSGVILLVAGFGLQAASSYLAP